MKIPFELWVENKYNSKEISDSAVELFKESIICYKVSAYRSAFITSYIGFQSILKERILKTNYKPSGINNNNWNEICNKLGDDDLWDSTVADCVKRKNPDRIFLITDSIISEYENYRVLRNKSAHGKSGKIEYFHIESFWNFIQDYFYKFIVNGGKSGIMQLIENHYDKTITPPDTDTTYIVRNIKSGILDNELADFINDFYSYCNQDNNPNPFSDRSMMVPLWDKLVNESDERIHTAIINHIKTLPSSELCVFVARYPSTTDEFLTDSAFARRLWVEEIKSWPYASKGQWIILNKIINNNIVPDNEKGDFDKNLYKCIGKHFSGDKINTLKKTGYFDILRSHIFDTTNYSYPNGIDYANRVSNSFINYLNHFELDKESVQCINVIFSFATYGAFYNDIINYLSKDNNIAKYRGIVKEENLVDYSEKFESE